MAEDTQPTTEPASTEQPIVGEQATTTQGTSAETVNTDSPVSPYVSKDRFNEVNEAKKAAVSRAQTAETELTKVREAQAKADREASEKRGEFEDLYKAEQTKVTDLTTQLETATKRVTELEAIFTAQLEKRKEGLPDHIKPLLDNMDALDALTYLDEHANDFAQAESGPRKQTAPPMHGADGAQKRGEKQPLFSVGRVKL